VDPYLDVSTFRARTVMPPEDVDYLEERAPGFLLSRLRIATSRIDAKLRKRYAVPFVAPVAEIVLGWVTAIVTVDAYQKRGANPSDAQFAQIVSDRDLALEELEAAANAETGLFELPLREDAPTNAVTRGVPLAYSEPSPYDWIDKQAEALNGRS